MSRYVYNLELTDLPLDRLTEQKTKKIKATGSKYGGFDGPVIKFN